MALLAIERVERADAAFFRSAASSGTSTERITALLRLLAQSGNT